MYILTGKYLAFNLMNVPVFWIMWVERLLSRKRVCNAFWQLGKHNQKITIGIRIIWKNKYCRLQITFLVFFISSLYCANTFRPLSVSQATANQRSKCLQKQLLTNNKSRSMKSTKFKLLRQKCAAIWSRLSRTKHLQLLDLNFIACL